MEDPEFDSPAQAGDFSQNIRPNLELTQPAIELVIEVISLLVKRH